MPHNIFKARIKKKSPFHALLRIIESRSVLATQVAAPNKIKIWSATRVGKKRCSLGWFRGEDVGRIPQSRLAQLAKSAMICGTAVSNPTTSNIPPSFGSAMLKPFETMPTTISLAGIPVRSRY